MEFGVVDFARWYRCDQQRLAGGWHRLRPRRHKVKLVNTLPGHLRCHGRTTGLSHLYKSVPCVHHGTHSGTHHEDSLPRERS